ncbi:MAG: NAD(P)-dependent oxidoreductase [Pirellulales bacterium]|nr:NAD(P)-dependent oxidoreductase [Pirellulales bacterium]
MVQNGFITGVSGFVGTHLAEYLATEGDAVLACDRVAPKPLPGIAAGSSSRVDWIPWDLADPEGLKPDARRRVEQFGPDAIYHLAAISIPADCGRGEPTPEAWAVNVEGTRRVVELAASLASRPRVVMISTSHVYAPVTSASPVVTEQSPLDPADTYGKTKLAAERLALELGRREGLDVVVVRAFHHTGPGQVPRMMLPEWASQFAAASDEPVKVHTLDAHLDLSDVHDVVRAYRLLAERGAANEVYNVGSGVNRRSGDLFELLRKAARSDRPVVELRPGRKQEHIADISRLAAATGWRPEIPIEQTIADTLAWWRAQQ